MDSRFDDILHTVITEKGQGIYGFFDVIFGFMYKRTDFFYEMAPGENMGFFPGQAEAIVYNYFRKYQAIHYKERVPKRDIDPKEIEEFIKSKKEGKGSQGTGNLGSNTTDSVKTTETVKNEVVSTKVEEKPKEKIDQVHLEKINLDSKIQEPKVISISTYNGDSCDNYNWSQGIMDVNIQINLPPIQSKKDVT
jgi:hypothetical protein